MKNKNLSGKKIAFVIDDASFHSGESIRNICKDNNIELIVLPGGTTSILQPLDVVVNKPFKDAMRERYVEWLMEVCKNPKKITKSGYLKPPAYSDIFDWIESSKVKIKGQFAVTSFWKTGITCEITRKEIFSKLAINLELQLNT